ncbi:MAG: 4Fe-4S dicluster domain-containing protein, partial [Verrucomicrobiota bacterium]
YILEGSVDVVIKGLPDSALGRREKTRAPFFQLIAKAISSGFRAYPEIRSQKRAVNAKAHERFQLRLQDFPEILLQEEDQDEDRQKSTVRLRASNQTGQIFGEIAAIGRTPRSATVLGGSHGAKVLEIRWQGLREIRMYSPSWSKMIDDRYRSRSLRLHLEESEHTRNVSRTKDLVRDGDADSKAISQFDFLIDNSQFRSYGEFAWQGSYREIAAADPAERLRAEPMIVEQGGHANGLFLVRNGFVRVRHKYNHGEKTTSYLGKGQSYGMVELYYNWKKRALGGADEKLLPYQQTLSAVGYVDMIFIPAHVVEEIVIPALDSAEVKRLENEMLRIDRDREAPLLDEPLLEFLVEERAINGSAAMLIDLDRCTRCDDCVRACASTHDNNPRFIRHGPELNGIQLTHACMHCADPVCLIGCPTGAIHRSAPDDQVVINDMTCIGCSTCADNCPYHNIQMVEIRDPKGDFVPGTERSRGEAPKRLHPDEAPIQKATKCDLCESLPTGPACQYACPHDALVRIDLRKPDPLIKWLSPR